MQEKIINLQEATKNLTEKNEKKHSKHLKAVRSLGPAVAARIHVRNLVLTYGVEVLNQALDDVAQEIRMKKGA